MKYYTKSKKPLNYFERQKQRSHPKKYRHYFLPDYLYYCGEKWREKKGARTDGVSTLFIYWGFCVMLPLYPRLIPLPIPSLTYNERVVLSLVLCFIPPIAFSLLRYRKERRSALMNHYRRSAWCKGIPVWLVCLGWFPLCIVEFWILKGMGWI